MPSPRGSIVSIHTSEPYAIDFEQYKGLMSCTLVLRLTPESEQQAIVVTSWSENGRHFLSSSTGPWTTKETIERELLLICGILLKNHTTTDLGRLTGIRK